MKITAGLGSIDEYVRYVEAGADEFFCGYVPYEWNKKYGTVLPLNRRAGEEVWEAGTSDV